MLQPQLINLSPNPQTDVVRPGRLTAKESGIFGKMLNQESAALPDGPRPLKSRGSAKPEAAQQPEEQPELEQDGNLYAFPLLTPPVEPQAVLEQPDTTGEKVWVPHPSLLRITQTLVSILEGYPNNTPVDTEIVPLLEEYAQLLAQLEQPASPKVEELLAILEEVLARMPQNEENADLLPQLDKLNWFIEALRGDLSPLENANEDMSTALPEAGLTPLKPTEHTARPQADAGNKSGSDAESKQANEPQSEVNANTLTARFDIAPHKVSFAENLSAAEAPRFTPLTAENLFDAMVERIVQLPDAEPHMEISLKPDHLGKISIDLVLGENGLTAKIIASDEGVRNLLAAHINRLSDTLAEKGIRVENVEVVYSALADKPFDQRQPGEQQQGKNGNIRNASLWGAAETAPAWWENVYDLPLYTDEWGVGTSSVEYRA